MKEFTKNYDFNQSEKKWQDFWREQKIYLWDKKESRKNTFVVDTPPPTVSGQLHIGHVYSYTQADFIVRFQRMLGKNIFYPMGFDDNGLPTERLVEKQRQVRPRDLPRQEFIKICQEVVKDEEEKFRQLFNRIALSVDWNLEYQTISPLSQTLSQMSFLDLIDKNEIYRDAQPMLWDPIDQTALAQADIEDKEKNSSMNDIVFKSINGEELIIATTRPELLSACVAVFYHPDDKRYQHLSNSEAISPLFNVKVPIIADELVQIEKGTGLVMCCTFGDQTDILWWKKHKLPTKIIIDGQGKLINIIFDEDCLDIIEAQSFATQLIGLKINAARAKTIELLKGENLLVKQTEIIQTVKCAERSGGPLEILTSPQWFVRTINHKEALLKKAQELNWYPKSMKIRLENWLNSIAWDWCISRQRYFGVPFPVWYSKRAGEEGKVLFAYPEQLPVDPTVDLPRGYSRDEVDADMDVMDTWATSSISPQICTHGISEKYFVDQERHQKLFPADLRPQAHEIIRTWAFYTMLKSYLHQGTLPWHNIMISGWCLAEDRTKMSKSKGNTIVPEKLLEQYGADVIRYWAATFKPGADTAYSEDVMKNGKRLVNKLWNAAKFSAQHFEKLDLNDSKNDLIDIQNKIIAPMDQWLITRLVVLVDKVNAEMQKFEYSSAMNLVEVFFWRDFCDNYLEISKVRVYNENNQDEAGHYSAVLTLYHTLKTILKLFSPFVPHITEEIYQSIYKSDVSIHARGSWPKMFTLKFDPNVENDGDILIEILDLVRKAKTEKNLSIKTPISLIEIIGVNLSPELTIELKNVTNSTEILLLKKFSKLGDQQSNNNLSINIIF